MHQTFDSRLQAKTKTIRIKKKQVSISQTFEEFFCHKYLRSKGLSLRASTDIKIKIKIKNKNLNLVSEDSIL